MVASGGTTPYTYAWSGGGNTPTIGQLAAGIYTVTVTDTNLCTSATVVTVGTVVGTRGIGNLHNLLLYPNPTTGKTLVLGDFGQPTDLTVRLTNTIGQTMLTQNLANVTHLYLPLDLSMYAEGVYFVTLQTADGQVIRKVILTR